MIAAEKKFVPVQKYHMAARVAGCWYREEIIVKCDWMLSFNDAFGA
jgi:hypothetical protein